MSDSNNDDNSANSSSGRTLGGDAAEPMPEAWRTGTSQPRVGRIGGPTTAARPTGSGGGFASLRDFAGSGDNGPAPRGHGHGHGGGGDDSDEDQAGESWFTGGERSGLNVLNPESRQPQGPSGIVGDILRKAAAAPRAPQDPTPARSTAFSGSGNTLGSEDVESRYVPDPDAPVPGEQETAIRNLTFWREGFSIEDGPLMRYDDPANQTILNQINSGNAPPSVLNVQVNQPVELRVAKRNDEPYQPPPKANNPFAGSGNRLGSIQPSTQGASTSSAQPIPGTFPTSASGGAQPSTFDESRVASITTRFEVDMSQPTTSVQIRLADGTRLVSRMNLHHTVGDIRGFINASRPSSEQRPYAIGTTFPNKTLDDDSLTIEAGGLKNSVIVQRYI